MYLSTETVLSAYKAIVNCELTDAGLLYHTMMLKGVGFNDLEYRPISEIALKSFDPAFSLSSLFTPKEELPDKFQFANPFSMKSWSGQAPSEPLDRYVRSRVKNNVLGGATTWKKFTHHDADTDMLKFKRHYAETLKDLCNIEKKVDFVAFSIWVHRFNQFVEEVSVSFLIQNTIDRFNIEDIFLEKLFTRSSNIRNIVFSASIHSASSVRQLIGKPDSVDSSWIGEQKEIVIGEVFTDSNMRSTKIINNMETSTDINDIEEILLNYKQIIFYGPPGTSKSYIAEKISEGFDECTKIQFHPTYSYQDFIGGYIVDGTEVRYQIGILPKIIENLDEKKKHLLIIDEINRANLNQVFGEVVQCLDRKYKVDVKFGTKLSNFNLPENLYIIGTMNSSDRSVGGIDHAIRRRFMHVYCPPTPNLLKDHCKVEDDYSLEDFLSKLNNALNEVLKNKDLAIGHAVFLKSGLSISEWSYNELEKVLNYKIIPTIEEYCNGDNYKITQILGKQLPRRLKNGKFIAAMKEFISQ